MPEYAIEADPGKLTASFPTFDSLDAALRAATVPAFEREGLPWPRVLTRRGGQWYAVCCAPTWHGPCILLEDHDPHSAYHRGGGRDQFERSEYEGNWPERVPTAKDFPDCRECQMWRDAGASWPRPCKKHYRGEPR